jgi:hypothetical protein
MLIWNSLKKIALIAALFFSYVCYSSGMASYDDSYEPTSSDYEENENFNSPSSIYNYNSASSSGSKRNTINQEVYRPKTVHVRGYYRKDGTYVSPHCRSKPIRKGY